MKRVFTVLTAALLMLSSTACGTMMTDFDESTFDTAQTDADISGVTAEAVTADTAQDGPTQNGSEESSKEISGESDTAPAADANVEVIGKSLLFDGNGIRITAESVEYPNSNNYGAFVNLTVENTTDKRLIFTDEFTVVNGYMADATLQCSVLPGESASAQLQIYKASLDVCGIDTVADIEISVGVYDASNGALYVKSEPMRIETSAAKDFGYSYDRSGTAVFSENGVLLVYKSMTKDSKGADGALFYAYNGRDEAVTLYSTAVKVNGISVDSIFSQTVAPGKHFMGMLTFDSAELIKKGIDSIKTVDVSFSAVCGDSRSQLVEGVPFEILCGN